MYFYCGEYCARGMSDFKNGGIIMGVCLHPSLIEIEKSACKLWQVLEVKVWNDRTC